MKNFDIELMVGLFMIAGILCLGYLSIKIGKMEVFGSKGYELQATFSNSGGLKVGSGIIIAGVQVKQTTDKLLAVLSDPALKPAAKSEERKKLIGKAVDERFDWEEMSRRSLARHWAQRTPEEKKEFIPLFRSLLEQTYLDKVQGYSGEKVSYDGDSVDGDYGLVKVKILTTTNKEIPVEYRLLKRGNNWLVYDISIEGEG